MLESFDKLAIVRYKSRAAIKHIHGRGK